MKGFWTPERRSRAEALLNEKLSYDAVARALHTKRGAIAGFAARLRQKADIEPKKRPPKPQGQTTRPDYSIKPKKGHRYPSTSLSVWDDLWVGKGISLLTAGLNQCRFPRDGFGPDRMPRCCGLPTRNGVSYCPNHTLVVYDGRRKALQIYEPVSVK